MELNNSMLTVIAQSNPGDFLICKYENCCLNILFTSLNICELFEINKTDDLNELKNKISEKIPKSDLDNIKENLLDIINKGTCADFRFCILRENDEPVWIHTKAKIIGKNENVPIVIANFEDATSETEEFRFLMDNSKAIVYVVAKDTMKLLYGNEKALRLWKRRDYFGKVCHSFVNNLDDMCSWCSISKMKNGNFDKENCYDPQNDRWVNICCRDMQWHGIDAVVVYGNDVTEEMRKRKSLELDMKSLNTTINNIPIGIGVCEYKNGTYDTVSVNFQLTEMMGMTTDNFSSSDTEVVRRIHIADRRAVVELIHNIRQTNTVSALDFRFMRYDEKIYRWYHVESRIVVFTDKIMNFISVADITSEKKAEENRIRTRKIYESAVKEAKLSVWEYDILNHTITFAMTDNKSIQQNYILSIHGGLIENVPYSLLPYMDENCKEEFLEMYKTIENGASKAECDIWWYKKSNHLRRWCEHISYNTIFDENGKPVKAYGISHDITAIKLDEERYKNINKQLTDTIAGSVGSAHLDLTENKCISVRSPYQSVVERQKKDTADEFFRAVFSDVNDSHIRYKYMTEYSCVNLLKAFQKGHKQLNADYPVAFSNGEQHWMNSTVAMMQNPKSGSIEAITYAIDVTEQKKNEEIIYHLTRKKFDYIALIAPISRIIEFCSKYDDKDFEIANEKKDYDEWNGNVKDNFVADDEKELYYTNTKLERIIEELEAYGDYTVSFQQNENGIISYRQIQYSWLNNKRTEILAVRSDITTVYEHEQKQFSVMKKAMQDAKRANDAKTEFLSRMSHDIRTPMNGIIGMTHIAQEQDNPQQTVECLKKIDISSEYLLGLINDVLDMTRIESGEIRLHPQPYPVEEFHQYINSVILPLCNAKYQKFIYSTSISSDYIPVVDKLRINQIVFNLLSNAVKYTNEYGIIRYSAKEIITENGMNIYFSISDNGRGISEDFQKVLFEPFTQEDTVRSMADVSGSSGLGLSIVKRIVTLMNGTIDVDSKENIGTTFNVYLPLKYISKDEYRRDVSEKNRKFNSELLKGKRILLCEDNSINQEIAVRLIKKNGMIIETATNGLSGKQMFEHSSVGYYDAVLMDLRMPLMDGYETTCAIRKMEREDAVKVPIIAMTADTFEEDIRKCQEAGMNAHIAKPIQPNLLYETLYRCIFKK